MSKQLKLSLDSMFQSEYYYTDYDTEGYRHSIIINESDREAFLDAFATEWRKRADEMLEEIEEEEG